MLSSLREKTARLAPLLVARNGVAIDIFDGRCCFAEDAGSPFLFIQRPYIIRALPPPPECVSDSFVRSGRTLGLIRRDARDGRPVSDELTDYSFAT